MNARLALIPFSLLLALPLALAGCGNKGPLVLPPKPIPVDPATLPAEPAAPADAAPPSSDTPVEPVPPPADGDGND